MNLATAPRRLVLASTSRYRRELLARLRLDFTVAAPGVDEDYRDGEAPAVRAERLAVAKAEAVAAAHPEALIVGSDQVAALGDHILDKPGNYENALVQLRAASGKRVAFYTAVAVHDARRRATSARVVPYYAEFRTLDDREIDRYLRADEPYDCAAAAKAESLGIALLTRMEGDDPTAIIGLPLIALSALLRQHGLSVL
jgi:septum formation protein